MAIEINLNNVASATDLSSHELDVNNPHAVTKTQVGLSDVDNTSDVNKPISSATQTALNGKEDLSNKQTDLTPSATKYPTVNAVNTGLSGKLNDIPIDSTPTSSSTNLVTSGGVFTGLGTKQEALVSGTNIKSVNGNSLLGSGDLVISGGGGTPAGLTGQIQFNNGGAFGADSGLFWDNTLKRLILKAVGSTGTDIPFRVRNSADTADLFIINGNKAFNLGGGIIGDGFTTYLSSQTGVTQITASGNGLVMTSNYLTQINAANQVAIQTNSVTRIHLDNVGNVGIGSSTTLGARLDVRAQGALSTDIAFRVRNSADTVDLFYVNGSGGVFSHGKTGITSNIVYGSNTALQYATTGVNNISIGNGLGIHTSGSRCVAIGNGSMYGNGNDSIAIGFNSGGLSEQSVTVGGDTSAAKTRTVTIGFQGGQYAVSTDSVFIGTNAGRQYTSGFNSVNTQSVIIGSGSKTFANSGVNEIVIGYNAIGEGSNTATIGNTSIVKTILRGTLNAANLPTSETGLVAGDIWNNLGILTIV